MLVISGHLSRERETKILMGSEDFFGIKGCVKDGLKLSKINAFWHE